MLIAQKNAYRRLLLVRFRLAVPRLWGGVLSAIHQIITSECHPIDTNVLFLKRFVSYVPFSSASSFSTTCRQKVFFVCRRAGIIATGMNEGERARESHDGKARGRLFAPGSPS